MMTRKHLAPLVVGLLLGCGALAVWIVARGGGTAATAAPAASTGTVTGTVTFKGTPPARVPLERNTDPICAQTAKLSEKIVVTAGKLRDVHVRIKSGTAGKHKAPRAPAVVNQLECMYTPRVIGVMAGQSVAIRNSDPTYHNVRGTKDKRTEWNLGQPPRAPDIIRDNLGQAGEVVTLRCDVHPWMRAYAVITDHPYFAVTGDNGAFTLKNVPVGRHVIEAWHPELGLKSATVTVGKGATATATLSFP